MLMSPSDQKTVCYPTHRLFVFYKGLKMSGMWGMQTMGLYGGIT